MGRHFPPALPQIRVIVESAQNSDSLRHSAVLTCHRFLWQIVSAVVIFKLKNC